MSDKPEMTTYKVTCEQCGEEFEVTEPARMPFFYMADGFGNFELFRHKYCRDCLKTNLAIMEEIRKNPNRGFSTNEVIQREMKRFYKRMSLSFGKEWEKRVEEKTGIKITIKDKENIIDKFVRAQIDKILYGKETPVRIELEEEKNDG